MFYESFSQTIILIAILIVIFFLFANLHYRAKKQIEYKNDERWKLVLNKASNISMIYYNVLAFSVFAAYLCLVIFNIDFSLSFEKVLKYSIYLLLVKSPVDYFSIRFYDKTI